MASEAHPSVTIGPALPADLPDLEALLRELELPLDGLADHLGSAVVARRASGPVGCAALEVYGADALLRSVATRSTERGCGLGQALVRAALALAARQGVRRVWLLTTTAERFFPRFGFRRFPREAVPEAMLQSAEFRGACPATAVLMRLDLTPADAG